MAFEDIHALLVDLYEWNAQMGYFDAPVWDRCKAMRDELLDEAEGHLMNELMDALDVQA